MVFVADRLAWLAVDLVLTFSFSEAAIAQSRCLLSIAASLQV